MAVRPDKGKSAKGGARQAGKVAAAGPRIVHGKHRSYPIWVVIAATSVLVLVIATGVLDYLQARAEARQNATQDELAELADRYQTLRDEKRRLLEQITALQRAQKIDRTALSVLRAGSADHQSQVARLQRKLAFYESIVDSGDKKPGLHVHQLRVSTPQRDGKPSGVFKLELVLRQVSRSYKTVNGEISVRLTGTSKGKPVTVSLSELSGKKHPLKFRFKYFQDFQQMFRLPRGFEPDRVQVTVRSLNKAGKRIGKFEKRYTWQQAMATVGWTG